MTTEPDLPSVPGLEPADGRTRPLDMSQDPDRFHPDRSRPPGQGQSLPELLGEERTYQGERDGYQWAFGLLGVLVFLALVAYLFANVLEP